MKLTDVAKRLRETKGEHANGNSTTLSKSTQPCTALARVSYASLKRENRTFGRQIRMVDVDSLASTFLVASRDVPCVSPAFTYLFWTGTSPAQCMGINQAPSSNFRTALEEGLVTQQDDVLWGQATKYIAAWEQWRDSAVFTLTPVILDSPLLVIHLTSARAQRDPIHRLVRALLNHTTNAIVPYTTLKAFPLHQFSAEGEDPDTKWVQEALQILVEHKCFQLEDTDDEPNGVWVEAQRAQKHLQSSGCTAIDEDFPTTKDHSAHRLSPHELLGQTTSKTFVGSRKAALARREFLGSASLNIFDIMPFEISQVKPPLKKLQLIQEIPVKRANDNIALVVPTRTSVPPSFWAETATPGHLHLTLHEYLTCPFALVSKINRIIIVLTPDWTPLQARCLLGGPPMVGFVPPPSLCLHIEKLDKKYLKEKVEEGLFTST